MQGMLPLLTGALASAVFIIVGGSMAATSEDAMWKGAGWVLLALGLYRLYRLIGQFRAYNAMHEDDGADD